MEARIVVVGPTDHQDGDRLFSRSARSRISCRPAPCMLVELFERAEALVDRPVALVLGDSEALPPASGACTS